MSSSHAKAARQSTVTPGLMVARASAASLLLIVGTAFTMSCKGLGDMSAPRPTGAPVASVVLSKDQLRLSEGTIVALQVTAFDANNRPLSDRTAIWSSSDATLAPVSGAGVITALRAGAVQISASIDGRSAVAQLIISARAVASVQLTPMASSVLKGASVQLTARALDEVGAPLVGRPISWETSDSRIVDIDANGLVTGLSPGVVIVTATSGSRSASVGVNVSAVPVASVQLTPLRDSIVLGQATQLTATPRDSIGAPLDDMVTFSSNAATIASVSSSGLVLGIAAGAATITASSGGRAATASITVRPRPVGAVIVSPSQSALTVGQSLHLTVQITDGNGNLLTGRPMTFSSSSVNVAQVSANGTVTALTPGAVTITVSSEGKSSTVTATVTPSPIATLQVDPTSRTLLVGGTVRLSAIALDAAGNALTQRTVTWTSGAPSVVLVSADGVVTAVGPGTALVLAAAEGTLASATITVTAPAPSTVHVSPAPATVVAGLSLDLVATIRDATGQILAGHTVQWVSGTPTIAVVSSTGRVRGVSPGVTRIDAMVDGVIGSTTFTVLTVPIATVSVALAPNSVIVGQTAQASAVLRDSSGNVLTQRLLAWASSNLAVATVSVTGVVNAVATGTASIVASSEGKTGQSTLSVVVGSPTTLAANSVVSQSATVLTAVASPPSVKVTDVQGNPVRDVAVAFTRTVGGGVIVPASPATVTTNASGVATLTRWTLGATPGTNTVIVSTTGVSGSPVTFNATGTTGAATQLVVTTQPAGAVSGTVFTTQPVVAIRDVANNLTSSTAAVTAAIVSGNGALTGTTTVNAVNGLATFTTLRLAGSGAHTLTFTSSAVSSATSTVLTVTQVAASLFMQTQPAGATNGVAFTTQPVVRILDNAGLAVTTGSGATEVVTATVATGTGTLSGTVTVTAVNGVATFSNVKITGTGAHTLRFATNSRTLTVTSTGFTVAASPPTQLAITTQPSAAVSGVAFTTKPVVAIRDGNNATTTSSAAVTVALGSGTGTLTGTKTVNAVNGVATFVNLQIAGPGAHTLIFTSGSLTSATSTAVNVTQVAASLAMETQPAGATDNREFTTQPVVRILDNAGMVVATGSGATEVVTASIASGSGRLRGEVTAVAVGGVARFTNLKINGRGPHTIRFATTTPTLSVISTAITIP